MRLSGVCLAICIAVLPACSREQPSSSSPPLETVPDGRYNATLESDCRDRLDREPEGETFLVFFICEDLERAGSPDAPSAVSRALEPGGNTATQVLEALFDGPTGAERKAGFTSGFGKATGELRFSYRRTGNVGVVDLSGDFLDVEFLFVPVSHFAEIVSTAGALEGIERVAILVDGEPICEKVEC